MGLRIATVLLLWKIEKGGDFPLKDTLYSSTPLTSFIIPIEHTTRKPPGTNSSNMKLPSLLALALAAFGSALADPVPTKRTNTVRTRTDRKTAHTPARPTTTMCPTTSVAATECRDRPRYAPWGCGCCDPVSSRSRDYELR